VRASNSSVSARAVVLLAVNDAHTQALRPSPLWVPSITATIGLCERARFAGGGGDAAAAGLLSCGRKSCGSRPRVSAAQLRTTRRSAAVRGGPWLPTRPLGTIIGGEVAPANDMTWTMVARPSLPLPLPTSADYSINKRRILKELPEHGCAVDDLHSRLHFVKGFTTVGGEEHTQ
jgi:hypothetical protein